MYDFLLKLSFHNAGIFDKLWKNDNISKNGDDRIFEYDTQHVRKQAEWIDSTFKSIHVSFINNVIHVLCGLRPQSKYRQTCVKQNNNLTKIAQRSFIKIDSLILINPINNKNVSFETQQTIKCVYNCVNKNQILCWSFIESWLSNDLFQKLIHLTQKYCSDEILLEKIILNLRKYKNQNDIQDFINLCSQQGKTELINLILDKTLGINAQGNALTICLTTKSIANITRIDGFIYIPISKEELSLFENGTGYATLFDGGIVLIDDIIDLSYTTIEQQTLGAKEVEK